ncbi:ATP synthase subunit g [Escovopsis weberi]|uniref:ATP synthase subunit g n=1 Tax=Escovopsis weberi TaxID=150374 RepID=A0A0M9VU52_ESCWE|nr:ATP synthase subunit g [Escovopsis weberi]
MAPLLARPMLRSPVLRRLAFRRCESTSASKAATEAVAKSKDIQAKAVEGLSRVSSAAGPAIAGAAKGVTNALTKIGGRTGQLVKVVEKHTPTVIYYGKVGAETAKIVFHGQKMAPPTMATFQSFYESLWNGIRSGTLIKSPTNLVQSTRNLTNAQLLAAGVVFAECLGFFTVGEMIGRFKLIGYRGQTASHH